MPPEPGSPADWMRFAHGDLEAACRPLGPGGVRETLTFHAQQAAEKSIKAVLIHYGVPFPRSHSMEHLMGLIPPEVPRPACLLASVALTPYATVFRYPGGGESVSEEQCSEAARLAEAVVAWAESVIGEGENPS